ncbi:MAG: hypothetical protein QM770_16085 [Tepidisphaeraceae bacterium]
MSRRLLAIACIGLCAFSSLASAQNDPNGAPPQGGQPGQGGPGGQGGQRGQRGNFDPAEMRQRMLDRLKENLKSPDDEWNVLKPKVEKLMQAQQDARAGGMFGGGFGGRGGFGGPGGPGGQGGGRGNRGGNGGDANQPETPLQVASRELRTVLTNDNATSDEVANKLKAYRDARKTAEEAVAAARKEVQEVIDARQEAVLVMWGMLE